MAKSKKVKVDLVKDCDAGKAGEIVSLAAADAEKLVASGDAQLAGDGATELALLVDCNAGKAGEVVALPDAEAQALVDAGDADDSEAAVAHRKRENAPKDSEKALEG